MKSSTRIRVAFIKFAGLAIGGTELRLQTMALNLPRDLFDVDYYYSNGAPYAGSGFKPPNTDEARLSFLQSQGLNMIRFEVGAVDFTTPSHNWLGSNFGDVFQEDRYDLVQVGKTGPAEYPFYLLKIPVVELVALDEGVDTSANIAWSIHPSTWQRARWCRRGGRASRSSVIPNPALPPSSTKDFRDALGIPAEAVVAGFIQRNDDRIFSSIPLEAFRRVFRADRHFLIMNGSALYRRQASSLNNVHFLPSSPHQEAVSTFLNSLDIFAHGRKDGETYGTILSEAMAHGKPCLSHFVAGGANAQPETMGPCGLFAKDVADYAAKLENLFQDAKLREQLAEKAKAMAREYYALEPGMEDLQNIYFRIVGRNNLVRPDHRLDYGLSEHGFLISGPLADPQSYSHSVLSGDEPHEWALRALLMFMQVPGTYVDVGAETGLFGLYLARFAIPQIRILLEERDPIHVAYLQRSLWLNNWENRISLIQTTDDWSNDAQLRVLRIGRSLLTESEIQKLVIIVRSRRPVIMLEANSATLVLSLGEDYNWLECDSHSIGIPRESAALWTAKLSTNRRNLRIQKVKKRLSAQAKTIIPAIKCWARLAVRRIMRPFVLLKWKKARNL